MSQTQAHSLGGQVVSGNYVRQQDGVWIGEGVDVVDKLLTSCSCWRRWGAVPVRTTGAHT